MSFWSILQRCWHVEPTARPNTRQLSADADGLLSRMQDTMTAVRSLTAHDVSSGPSSNLPVRPITDAMSQGLQIPSPLVPRAPSDVSMFPFDPEINMLTSPGSMIYDPEDTQFKFGSLMSIDENSDMTSYPQEYDPPQPQQTRTDLQQAPFQFSNFVPSNITPVKNHVALLFQRPEGQAPAASLSSSVPNSRYRYYSPSRVHDGDGSIQAIFPLRGMLAESSRVRRSDQKILPSYPIRPANSRDLRYISSRRKDHLNTPVPGVVDATDLLLPPGTSSTELLKHFGPHQQQAVINIMNYQRFRPDTAIPASFITADLAEVQDGRGWCLLGNCGIDRAKQRLNPHYDLSKDNTRKRLDHLYDHIRDKHFNCRPFRCPHSPCAQTFSREHDLKRHERTHTAVFLPCNVCGKNYTQADNLKRHVQLKHPSLPQQAGVLPA